MKSLEDIDIFQTLEYIKNKAREYAIAKANRMYVEEYRKTLKAKIMAEDKSQPVNAQERNAYSHPSYEQHLLAIQAAVEKEEELRWKLIAAQAMVNCWQTLSANERAEKRLM